MKRNKYSLLLLLAPLLMLSCGKELSVETGRLPGDTTPTTPVTNNCNLAQIVQADLASGKAEIAFVSAFNSEHKAVTMDIVDSANNVILGSFGFSYPAGRIQIDAEQYFTVGSDGKITEFYGYESPDDNTSEKFRVKYTYNSAGQMTLRTETYDSLPNIVLYQMKFTYSGGNLVRQDIEGNTGLSFVKLGDVIFSYDAGKTVKSFINLTGLSPEISLFQTAINAGTNNTNPVTKVVTNLYNPATGAITNTLTTNFGNYVIDSKNYVQSFDVTGNDYSIAGIAAGSKYRLRYDCY